MMKASNAFQSCKHCSSVHQFGLRSINNKHQGAINVIYKYLMDHNQRLCIAFRTGSFLPLAVLLHFHHTTSSVPRLHEGDKTVTHRSNSKGFLLQYGVLKLFADSTPRKVSKAPWFQTGHKVKSPSKSQICASNSDRKTLEPSIQIVTPSLLDQVCTSNMALETRRKPKSLRPVGWIYEHNQLFKPQLFTDNLLTVQLFILRQRPTPSHKQMKSNKALLTHDTEERQRDRATAKPQQHMTSQLCLSVL